MSSAKFSLGLYYVLITHGVFFYFYFDLYNHDDVKSVIIKQQTANLPGKCNL